MPLANLTYSMLDHPCYRIPKLSETAVRPKRIQLPLCWTPCQAMIVVMNWMRYIREEGLLGFVTNSISVSEVKGMPHPKR